MFNPFKRSVSPTDLLTSELYSEETFYPAFLKDLGKCRSEVIIECPFITCRRLTTILPTLQKLKDRKVRIAINTRDPLSSDDEYMRIEAYESISKLQHMGIYVLYTNSLHRKVAILDRKILYEGSLNILSQNNSREIMRRIESVTLTWQMVRFVEIDKYTT